MFCRTLGLPGCFSDLSIYYNNSVCLVFNVAIWPLFPQSASFPWLSVSPVPSWFSLPLAVACQGAPHKTSKGFWCPSHPHIPYFLTKCITSKPSQGMQSCGGLSGLTWSLSIHCHHFLWKFWHFHLIYHRPFLFPRI